MPDEPKRLPNPPLGPQSARMLRADTDVHTAEEAARLRRHVHGEIRGAAVVDDDTPLPLPLAAEPTRTGFTDLNIPKLDPPRPPPEAPRPVPLSGHAPPMIDDSATVPVPLLAEDDTAPHDATPPPLPPSPASAAAEVWLEDAVTRPSIVTDLAAPPASLASSGQVPVAAAPAFAAFSPDEAAKRSARTLLVLSSVTSFAVGLVLGALLFRGRGDAPREPAQPAAAPTVCGPTESAPDGPR